VAVRVILAPLSGMESDRSSLKTAIALAERHGAHIDAVFVKADPLEAAPMIGEAGSGLVVEQVMRAAEKEIETRAGNARATFDEIVGSSGLALREEPGETGTPSIAFRLATGREDTVVAELGRLSDLVVLPNQAKATSDIQAAVTLEGALMASARPVLVSSTSGGPAGARIAIAWNGGVEAAHSVFAALPFLALADDVAVVSATTAKSRANNAEALVRYLGWHGVRASAHQIEPGDQPVGGAILDVAGQFNADLLVMGGYGHSRMRELIFGGVTRYALSHATIAVLMTH